MSQPDFSPIVAFLDSEIEPVESPSVESPSQRSQRSLDSVSQSPLEPAVDSVNSMDENRIDENRMDLPFTSERSVPEASSEESPDPNVTIYADRLMDEIFAEVEHTLESGVVPLEVEEPEVLNIRSLQMPSLALPSALVPRVDAYTPNGSTGSRPALAAGDDSKGPSPLIDRLLLGSVLLSCAITLGWWTIDRDRYATLFSSTPVPDLAISAAPSQAESTHQQFVAYLQASLEELDRQTASSNTSTNASTTGSTSTSASNSASNSTTASASTLPSVPSVSGELPTVTIPGTPNLGDLTPLPSTNLPVNPPQSTVLDRVYIPVYPNTPGLAAPQSTVAGSLPGILNPAPPLMASGNFPTAPVGAPAAPLAVNPSQPNPANPANSQQPGVAPVPQPVPQSAPIAHSLVGILELGEQSAALFQINGVTRRVHLGEAIGSAGWMLVDVNNQEAIIRRNGEVRSVYVGQNF